MNFIQTAGGIETITEGSSGQLEFTVNVGELENGIYEFHALAVDIVGNIQTDRSPKVTVHVENYKRPEPGILAITTDPAAMTNPDSGAPQGTITLNSYSIGERTSPPTTGVRFEIKRQAADDSEWQEVGVTSEGTVVDSEGLQVLQQNGDFLADLIHVAVETVVEDETNTPIHQHQAYRKWSVDIDTLALEDTIDAASPAARDVSLDTNPLCCTCNRDFRGKRKRSTST